MASIRKQIHNNAVALISLFIAVSSLAYNTWRNETTETQRNVRHAAFRVMEHLGELQQVVDNRYYYVELQQDKRLEGEWRLRGFGSAAMVHDLMMLMPDPAPPAGEILHETWFGSFESLDDLDVDGGHTAAARKAEQDITQAIREARKAVLEVLNDLE